MAKSPSSSSEKFTQKAIEIPYKAPHNYLGLLTKPSNTETFNSVIDALSSSKYKTLLTSNAPIYLATQREFWENAKLESQDEIPIAINSSIKGVKVKISPQTISEVFELSDLLGNSSMLADIPLPDGSKKIDVTTNVIATAKSSVKRDMEAKDKARFEQEKRVFMEMNEQGISEPKDEKNPKVKRKQPTRHQSPKPTDVKTPVVSTTVGTSIISTAVSQTTATTSTYTTTTACSSTTASPKTSSLPKITSPPKTTSSPPSSPAKKQKTSDDTLSVQPSTQITTTQSIKTPPTSPEPKRRTVNNVVLDDDTSPPQTSIQLLPVVPIPNPVPLSTAQVEKPNTAITPASPQYPLELIAVREEIKSFYTEDGPAKRTEPQKQQFRRSTVPPAAILYQRRNQNEMDKITAADKEAEDYVVKVGVKRIIEEILES
ncbi:proteoglycan 4-like [Helianthus annuus]|uniref:proteoglycan 4-like n=1 Tax=Helianthus annuus TaxID=4232 RepID=UPI000B8F3645|nr:proteoglycan 4-like [Helianthus annuus]